MANTCYTNVSIMGSEDVLDLLQKEFESALSKDNIPGTDYAKNWLGNLLLHIGMTWEEIEKANIRCRGHVVCFDRISKTQLCLDTETAWSPMLKCLDMFVNHFTHDAAIFYCAEEAGCDLFWSNDEDFIDHVYIDYCADEGFPIELEKIIDEVQYGTKEAVQDAFAKLLGHSGELEDLAEELTECLEDINEDIFFSVHIYENMPLAECA